jgi:hypothetical protein
VTTTLDISLDALAEAAAEASAAAEAEARAAGIKPAGLLKRGPRTAPGRNGAKGGLGGRKGRQGSPLFSASTCAGTL